MSKQQLARFDSLVDVRLINLRRCATLPSLGQLPRLRMLEISGMDLIKHIDDAFYGDGDIFPTLTKLTFSEMLSLEKWSPPKRKNVKSFPWLRELTLIQCPKFKEINLLCDSIFTMRVWLNNKTIWSVEFCNWDNLQYIENIEIVGCQELRRLPEGMRSLKRLTRMKICNCNNLVTLVALYSLQVLYLVACPVLAFNLEAFTTLSQLKINACPKMQIYYDAWMKNNEERRRAATEEEERRRTWMKENEEQWRAIEEERRRIWMKEIEKRWQAIEEDKYHIRGEAAKEYGSEEEEERRRTWMEENEKQWRALEKEEEERRRTWMKENKERWWAIEEERRKKKNLHERN
ncbi:hypothetical protein ZIOFF_036660 [Zingiber officinale]|uniref:Uncharacterized protein n=2 Tax=Zingiber officinale TaxID=94328 RepID=A0A8J5GHA1_ZINOF|nr:hypothetical protein ZIOFF_036660 [Zingiber officinale]